MVYAFEARNAHSYAGSDGPRRIRPCDALARYRLLPSTRTAVPARSHRAHSLRPVEGGWSWKFDVDMESGLPEPDGAALLRLIATPVDYVTAS